MGERCIGVVYGAVTLLVAYTVNAFADDVEGWRLAVLVFMAIASGVGEVYAIYREDSES